MATNRNDTEKALHSTRVARITNGSGNDRPLTLAIRGHQRRLDVPSLAGCRVLVTTDSDDEYAPLVVGADGVLELPCAADEAATRVFVRLAPTARAA